MHSGGVAGFAVMGQAKLVFASAVYGLGLSWGLALLAAIKIRAAWVLLVFEVVLGVLILWLVMGSGRGSGSA